jgi:hypothetical protein
MKHPKPSIEKVELSEEEVSLLESGLFELDDNLRLSIKRDVPTGEVHKLLAKRRAAASLFARGLSVPEIAKALLVPVDEVHRWISTPEAKRIIKEYLESFPERVNEELKNLQYRKLILAGLALDKLEQILCMPVTGKNINAQITAVMKVLDIVQRDIQFVRPEEKESSNQINLINFVVSCSEDGEIKRRIEEKQKELEKYSVEELVEIMERRAIGGGKAN